MSDSDTGDMTEASEEYSDEMSAESGTNMYDEDSLGEADSDGGSEDNTETEQASEVHGGEDSLMNMFAHFGRHAYMTTQVQEYVSLTSNTLEYVAVPRSGTADLRPEPFNGEYSHLFDYRLVSKPSDPAVYRHIVTSPYVPIEHWDDSEKHLKGVFYPATRCKNFESHFLLDLQDGARPTCKSGPVNNAEGALESSNGFGNSAPSAVIVTNDLPSPKRTCHLEGQLKSSLLVNAASERDKLVGMPLWKSRPVDSDAYREFASLSYSSEFIDIAECANCSFMFDGFKSLFNGAVSPPDLSSPMPLRQFALLFHNHTRADKKKQLSDAEASKAIYLAILKIIQQAPLRNSSNSDDSEADSTESEEDPRCNTSRSFHSTGHCKSENLRAIDIAQTCNRMLRSALSKKGISDAEIDAALAPSHTTTNVCAHTFTKGEIVFNCSDCSLDETCVMCVQCFNSAAHKHHAYKMYVSSSGGSCDCGDDEAWKQPICCLVHKKESEDTDSTPSAVEAIIEEAFGEIVIAMVRLVFEASSVHDGEIDKSPADMASALVIFNDDVHSFEDVIKQCMHANDCCAPCAAHIALKVDQHGYGVLKMDTDDKCVTLTGTRNELPAFMCGQRLNCFESVAARNGEFKTTKAVFYAAEQFKRRVDMPLQMCYAHEAARRVIVDGIMDWMESMCLQSALLAKCLVRAWAAGRVRMPLPVLRAFLRTPEITGVSHMPGCVFPYGELTCTDCHGNPYKLPKAPEFVPPIALEFYAHGLTWKRLSSGLQRILTRGLALSDVKHSLCEMYCHFLPHVYTDCYLFPDRLSDSMLPFAVQILTEPSVAAIACRSGGVLDTSLRTLSHFLTLLSSSHVQKNSRMTRLLTILVSYSISLSNMVLRDKAFIASAFHGRMHDVLLIAARALSAVDGNFRVMKKTGDHVEYEVDPGLQIFVVLQLRELVFQLRESLAGAVEANAAKPVYFQLLESAGNVLKCIWRLKIWRTESTFKSDPQSLASFIRPLYWHANSSYATCFGKLDISSIPAVPSAVTKEIFSHWATSMSIARGDWLRNGNEVRVQALVAFDQHDMNPETHLIYPLLFNCLASVGQSSLVELDAIRSLFCAKNAFNSSEDSLAFSVGFFARTLLRLLCGSPDILARNRTLGNNVPVTPLMLDVAHGLSAKPMLFSKLQSYIDGFIGRPTTDELREILILIADKRPSNGAGGDTFILKHSCRDLLSPYFWHLPKDETIAHGDYGYLRLPEVHLAAKRMEIVLREFGCNILNELHTLAKSVTIPETSLVDACILNALALHTLHNSPETLSDDGRKRFEQSKEAFIKCSFTSESLAATHAAVAAILFGEISPAQTKAARSTGRNPAAEAQRQRALRQISANVSQFVSAHADKLGISTEPEDGDECIVCHEPITVNDHGGYAAKLLPCILDQDSHLHVSKRQFSIDTCGHMLHYRCSMQREYSRLCPLCSAEYDKIVQRNGAFADKNLDDICYECDIIDVPLADFPADIVNSFDFKQAKQNPEDIEEVDYDHDYDTRCAQLNQMTHEQLVEPWHTTDSHVYWWCVLGVLLGHGSYKNLERNVSTPQATRKVAWNVQLDIGLPLANEKLNAGDVWERIDALYNHPSRDAERYTFLDGSVALASIPYTVEALKAIGCAEPEHISLTIMNAFWSMRSIKWHGFMHTFFVAFSGLLSADYRTSLKMAKVVQNGIEELEESEQEMQPAVAFAACVGEVLMFLRFNMLDATQAARLLVHLGRRILLWSVVGAVSCNADHSPSESYLHKLQNVKLCAHAAAVTAVEFRFTMRVMHSILRIALWRDASWTYPEDDSKAYEMLAPYASGASTDAELVRAAYMQATQSLGPCLQHFTEHKMCPYMFIETRPPVRFAPLPESFASLWSYDERPTWTCPLCLQNRESQPLLMCIQCGVTKCMRSSCPLSAGVQSVRRSPVDGSVEYVPRPRTSDGHGRNCRQARAVMLAPATATVHLCQRRHAPHHQEAALRTAPAPYRDEHGEADMGLRRGTPMRRVDSLVRSMRRSVLLPSAPSFFPVSDDR